MKEIEEGQVPSLAVSQLRRTLGRQAREWVSQERDWKHIVPRYVKIYESALARRSPRRSPRALADLALAYEC